MSQIKEKDKLYDTEGNLWIVEEVYDKVKTALLISNEFSYRLRLTVPFAVASLFLTKPPKESKDNG